MSYTLEDLTRDCRTSLNNDAGPDGRREVLEHVKRALRSQAFVNRWLGPDATDERRIIYEDADLGFCICAHVYQGEARGKPHDHGPTWAIYGQAMGETRMTDWDVVSPADDNEPARVRLSREYTLTPGDAHLYEPGDVHAPLRDAPTRLLRIEGSNTEHVTRTRIEAADPAELER